MSEPVHLDYPNLADHGGNLYLKRGLDKTLIRQAYKKKYTFNLMVNNKSQAYTKKIYLCSLMVKFTLLYIKEHGVTKGLSYLWFKNNHLSPGDKIIFWELIKGWLSLYKMIM